MDNILKEWLDLNSEELKELDFMLKVKPSVKGGATVVHIDGDWFAGSICFWEPDVVEFDFLGIKRGSNNLIETFNLDSLDQIDANFWKLLYRFRVLEYG